MTVGRHTPFLSIYTRLLNQTVLFLLWFYALLLLHLGPACNRNLICFHPHYSTAFTVTLVELFSFTFHTNAFPFLLVCSRQTERADLDCESSSYFYLTSQTYFPYYIVHYIAIFGHRSSHRSNHHMTEVT